MSQEVTLLEGDDPDADYDIPPEIDFEKVKVDVELTRRFREWARLRKEAAEGEKESEPTNEHTNT